MGASIGNAIGSPKAGTRRADHRHHRRFPPSCTAASHRLIDAVYNKANITVVILDNHITAMTGGQDHPGTGRTLRGEDTDRVDFEQMVRACGVKWVRSVDS